VKGAGVNVIKLLFSSPLTLRQKRAFVLGSLLQEKSYSEGKAGNSSNSEGKAGAYPSAETNSSSSL
jgi:hypothetical protein